MGEWRNWQTRTTQNRVPKGVRVRLPPRPPYPRDRQIRMEDFTFIPRTPNQNQNPPQPTPPVVQSYQEIPPDDVSLDMLMGYPPTEAHDYIQEPSVVAYTEPPALEYPEPITSVIDQPLPVDVVSAPASTPITQAETAAAPVSYADAQIQEIEVSKIVPNPYQPRKVFNQEALQELSNSIREHGVIQPLVVTETATGYELVVGERRFRASQLAGLTKVPAIVKKQLGDQTKLEVALIENIQRQELNPIEEAQAYDRLIKNFNLTQDEVAKKLGKARPTISNRLRLLNLPAEIQRGLVEGKITEGHARAILGLNDAEKQILMYHLALEQNLTVRQIEIKVRELTTRKTLDAAAPDPKIMAFESELRGKLGTQVKIHRQGKGGKITIEFFSEEELGEIIDRIAQEQAEKNDQGFLTV